MSRDDLEETAAFWDRVARDWDIHVGDDGDTNRILNSDPVLWRFAGAVEDLDVLDAGCGTGYLSKQLQGRGARVTGVDVSPNMIAIARSRAPDIEFHVDSCSELATVKDDSIDLVVANYVLMDTPDLDGAMRAFYRVLRPRGRAITIFSHPCFPQGGADSNEDSIAYEWEFSYFDERKRVDPPWKHFTSEFIWFHRPLSRYWRAFKDAGFAVDDFDEPRITEERYHLVDDRNKLEKLQMRPYSVAFKLQKRESG